MPVRVRYKIEASVSSDSNEARDLGNVAFEVLTDDLENGGTWKTKLPASTITPTQFPLDSIASAAVLIIRTNSKDPNEEPVAISLILNSPSNTPIVISPMPNAKEGHMLISTAGITALYLVNSGGADMEVSILACGDSP
jgi:hypothetical protein